MTTHKPTAPSEMASSECYRFLDSHRIGRICFTDADGPLALPISYRILGTEAHPYIVLRTASTTSLGNYDGPAALEVDAIYEVEHSAVSVLVRGALRAVRGPHELPDPQPWIVEARDRWMTLDVSAMTGRRFVARERGDGFSVEWQLEYRSDTSATRATPPAGA